MTRHDVEQLRCVTGLIMSELLLAIVTCKLKKKQQ